MRAERPLGLLLLFFLIAVSPQSDARAEDGCRRHTVLPSTLTPFPADRQWLTLYRKQQALLYVREPAFVLLGDSIIRRWPPLRVSQLARGNPTLNLGIGGDRIQNLLWRLDHLELGTVEPEQALLMIGANNMTINGPCEIAVGVLAAVDRLQRIWPETTIAVVGLLPKEGRTRSAAASNAALRRELEGRKNVVFVDATAPLLKDREANFEDALHPSARGYAILNEAVQAALARVKDPDLPASHEAAR